MLRFCKDRGKFVCHRAGRQINFAAIQAHHRAGVSQGGRITGRAHYRAGEAAAYSAAFTPATCAASCAARNFSASSAAMQPMPADVTAWR